MNFDHIVFNHEVVTDFSLLKEGELLKKWSDEIQCGDLVVDIGSNAGLFALVAAKKLNKSGKVVAFEPFFPNVLKIHENLIANQIDNNNVDIVPYALGNEISVTRMFVFKNEGERPRFKKNTITHKRISDDKTKKGHTYLEDNPLEYRNNDPMVSVQVTIDAYFSVLGRPPDVVKLDVDGDEYRVLEGGRSILRGSNARLFLEIHLIENHDSNKIWKLLNDLDLKVHYKQPKRSGSPHLHVIGTFM